MVTEEQGGGWPCGRGSICGGRHGGCRGCGGCGRGGGCAWGHQGKACSIPPGYCCLLMTSLESLPPWLQALSSNVFSVHSYSMNTTTCVFPHCIIIVHLIAKQGSKLALASEEPHDLMSSEVFNHPARSTATNAAKDTLRCPKVEQSYTAEKCHRLWTSFHVKWLINTH